MWCTRHMYSLSLWLIFFILQVPAVSDRLFLSIVSVDTGKTIAKSSKAAARSGICQWPDSILEPIWFSRDEVSKEYDECQYKIVVSVVWTLLQSWRVVCGLLQ